MQEADAPADWRNLSDPERFASGIGGALLLAIGLARRPTLGSALMAASGALLLERGLTGHCSLYRALGIDTGAGAQARSFEQRGAHSIREEMIERAAEGSFPASDPPSWSPHTAGAPADAG
jgi:uncharacterized membrane protein